jgi:hypothetical protein
MSIANAPELPQNDCRKIHLSEPFGMDERTRSLFTFVKADGDRRLELCQPLPVAAAVQLGFEQAGSRLSDPPCAGANLSVIERPFRVAPVDEEPHPKHRVQIFNQQPSVIHIFRPRSRMAACRAEKSLHEDDICERDEIAIKDPRMIEECQDEKVWVGNAAELSRV